MMDNSVSDQTTTAEADALAVLHGSVRCPLEGLVLLRVSGSDAADFLHRQFSSDIKGLAAGDAGLTAYSDPRGRVLAAPRILATGEGYLLQVPSDRLEPLRQQLAKFVLRSDVQLTPLGDDYAQFGIAGQNASVALAGAAGSLPQAVDEGLITAQGVTVVRLRGPRPRWLVHGPSAAVAEVWDALAGHARDATAADWRLLEIEAGIPIVTDPTAGRFVAQMLNLDRLGAVDFAKGCYPGQEVIAKTHYLGRLKRRMYVLRWGEGPLPERGAEVYSGDTAVGTCIDAAPHPDGGGLGLAVLRVDATEGDLALGEPGAARARAETPPYPLADAA